MKTASKFAYFDLGNVLIHFDHEIAVRQLSQVTGATHEEVRTAVFESDAQIQYETGHISTSEFAQAINESLGSHASEAELVQAASDIFRPNLEVLPVLEMLALVEIPMAILSNTCEGHWQWIANQDWPLPGRWFEFAVLSYEVNSMKPDSGIYDVCEERCRSTPTDIFFTDDREENILAAKQRGWTTHVFRNAQGLRSAIEDWLAN
ncbi:MAG: HAD family hydrolase [Pirellulaceae bacterium]